MPALFITAAAILFCLVIYLRSGLLLSKNGRAIKGYDPVAYFMQKNAVKGKSRFSFSWKGRLWMFSSQENLDLFKTAPEKYAPQYEGYCAFGCSESHLAIASPRAWTIINNKLYFNYSKKYKKIWLVNADTRITTADLYWAALSQ
jgi:YHS domain-containing protein